MSIAEYPTPLSSHWYLHIAQPFYSDFFDPPPRSKLDGKRNPSIRPKVPGKVKFHKQVSVKKFGEEMNDSFSESEGTGDHLEQIASDDSEATDDRGSPVSFRDDLLGDEDSDSNEETSGYNHPV